MNSRRKAELLKKRALDALLEMYNDQEYATHQHHSDPNFTTQTGKDYAGRGSTEPEAGVSVAIPSEDLHTSSSCSCGLGRGVKCPACKVGNHQACGYENQCDASVVVTDPKLAPPESVEEAEFFKESDPDPEMRPVEKEIEEHEFFKEAPEYEMRRASAGCPAYVARKTAKMCTCGHPMEIHSHPPDFGCPHEKDGCGCKGATEKKAAYEQRRLFAEPPTFSIIRNYDVYGMGRGSQPGWRVSKKDGGIWSQVFSTPQAAEEAIRKEFPDATIKRGKTAAVILPALKADDLRAIGRGEMTVDEWKNKEPEAAVGLDTFVASIKKEAHANVPDTGEYDFEHEAHVRKEMKQWAQYAEPEDNTDKIKPFDPTGQYLCGTCDMRRDTDQCMRVEGPISYETGSCRLYHLGSPETAPDMEKKFTKEEAKYSEHEDGFSCKRCEYGSAARGKDPDGRDSWCSFWGAHVIKDACCAEWNEDEKNETTNNVRYGSAMPKGVLARAAHIAAITAAGKVLYHVTHTSKVPSIQKKGILPLQESQWVKAETGERYGEGEIFAFNNPEDAVRWAAKMDWEFNQGMGTGEISIVVFKPGKEEWKIDTADPMGQAMAKGQWLKAYGAIKPEQIVKVVPVTVDMTRAVAQGKGIKLAGQKEKFDTLNARWAAIYKRIFSLSDRDVTLEGMKSAIAAVREMTEKLAEFIEAIPKDSLFAEAFVDPKHTSRYIPVVFERLDIAEAYAKQGREHRLDTIRSETESAAGLLQTAFHNLGTEYYWLEKDRENVTAAVTKSYGTGTPIGGTTNYPEMMEEDEEEEKLAAEEARIAAEVEAEDQRSIFKSAALAMNLDFTSFSGAAAKIAGIDDAGWWAKSARPTPQKLELLQKQFKITPEQIELAIAADPSPNQTDYVAWIAKWLSKGELRLPEDSEKIKEQLATFTKLKRSPAFTENKDIQQYNPAKLYEVLEAGTASKAVSKKEQDRETIAKGSKIVVNQDGLTIYEVTDPKALSLLSGGTNWCTANPDWGGRYLKNGPSYVIFEDNSAFAQFHPASNQLMNRQDVCMLERVYGDKPKTRGWGRSAPKAELIASFITDQTLLRALQLLSAVKPDVEKWVKENTSDPEQLVQILGEKAAEEQRQNEYYSYYERDKSWKMTVQHALASGQQLSPEMEAKLEKGVSTDLLFKYGTKFHAGQPWEPLGRAILAQRGTSKEIIDYAVKFVKGRWPEGEAKLLKGALLKTYGSSNMKLALEYVQRVIKGRWPELEAKLHKAKPGEASGYGSAEYAISILKQPWSAVAKPRKDGKINEEQVMIIGAPDEAQRYAATFMPGQRWTEFEQTALASGYLSALTDYAMNVVKGRMPEVEQAILSGKVDPTSGGYGYRSGDLALNYTEKVLKARWPEYEQRILGFIKSSESDKSGYSGRTYTPNIRGGSALDRWKSYHSGARLPTVIENYIKQMLKGRWPELEQALLVRYQEHPDGWVLNQTWVDGYLRTLNEMCEERYKDQLKAVNNVDERTNQLHGELNDFERAHDQAKKEVADKEREILGKDAQCVWPEGEQRLQSRDKNYEQVLLREFKERNDKWHEEAITKGDEEKYINYKGYWITWFGNEEIEKYVQYLDSIGQKWPFGDELMDAFEDIDDERNKSYGWHQPKKRRTRPTPEPQPVTSSLLKKAVVDFHEVPKFKPPREQYRKHIDQEAEQSVMEGVMDGVTQPLNGKPQQPRQKPQHKQFDPSLGGNNELSLMQQKMPKGFPQIASRPPAKLHPDIYQMGGWISPRGKSLALDSNVLTSQDYVMHEDLAEDMGFESNEEARQAGAIRIAVARGKYLIEVFRVTSSARERIREFLSEGPSRPVVIEWHSPKNGYEEFKDSEEAAEWLENRMVIAAEIVDPEIIPKRTGNWKLYAWPAGTVQFGQYGEIKRPVPKGQVWYVGDKAKALPILKENWDLSHAQENQLLELGALNLPDVILRLTNVDYYAQPMKFPQKQKLLRGSLLKKGGGIRIETDSNGIRWAISGKYRVSIPEGISDAEIESYAQPKLEEQARIHSRLFKQADRKSPEQEAGELLKRLDAETDEAYQAFLKEPYVLQEAQDRRVAPETLWKEIGKEYANEYFASLHNRDPLDWHAPR